MTQEEEIPPPPWTDIYPLHAYRCSSELGLQCTNDRIVLYYEKPKVQYIDRKCTLCNDNDIQDEYNIVLKCAYYIMKLEENILSLITIDTLACISSRN